MTCAIVWYQTIVVWCKFVHQIGGDWADVKIPPGSIKLAEFCNNMPSMLDGFIQILRECTERRTSDFAGVGVILYSSLEALPIFSLRDQEPEVIDSSPATTLALISSRKCSFHDGFHLMNHNLKLTHYSQYFSPPVVESVVIEKRNAVGGRYVAAAFGSTIKGVLLCGVVSTDLTLSVLQEGREVFSERIS